MNAHAETDILLRYARRMRRPLISRWTLVLCMCLTVAALAGFLIHIRMHSSVRAIAGTPVMDSADSLVVLRLYKRDTGLT
jgi:hypothetical protein